MVQRYRCFLSSRVIHAQTDRLQSKTVWTWNVLEQMIRLRLLPYRAGSHHHHKLNSELIPYSNMSRLWHGYSIQYAPTAQVAEIAHLSSGYYGVRRLYRLTSCQSCQIVRSKAKVRTPYRVEIVKSIETHRPPVDILVFPQQRCPFFTPYEYGVPLILQYWSTECMG